MIFKTESTKEIDVIYGEFNACNMVKKYIIYGGKEVEGIWRRKTNKELMKQN